MASGLIIFTHLNPQLVPLYEAELERFDVEMLVVYQHGRSSTYRRMANAYQSSGDGDAVRGLVRDRLKCDPEDYDFIVGACYSAGYGFWSEALKQDFGPSVVALVAVDSWYASKLGTPAAKTDLADLIIWAQRAREGQGVLWLGHGEEDPGSYAGTKAVAQQVVLEAGEPQGGFYVEAFHVGHHQAPSVKGPAFLKGAMGAVMDQRVPDSYA